MFYVVYLGAGNLNDRVLELAISLSQQGYSPDKITWLMNFLSSLTVEKEKSTKQEELFFGNIPDMPQKFAPGLHRGWNLILVGTVTSIRKVKQLEKTNLYFFFIGMVYLLLKSDSKFLHEFSYLWTDQKLES